MSAEKAGFQKQIKDTVVLQNSVFLTNVRVRESSKVRQFQFICKKLENFPFENKTTHPTLVHYLRN